MSTDKTKPADDLTPPMPPTAAPMSPELFNEVAGSFHRLRELQSFSILTQKMEVELRGITEFLANTFLKHGEEFLGAWITVRQEYQPLLRVIAQVTNRVGSIIVGARQVKAGIEAKAEQEANKSPIIT